jgi:apolipoprotein(a)
MSRAGRDFKGHLTVTKSGKQCQSWNAQTPNKHAYTQDSLYPDGSVAVADNRCRNPDSKFEDGPWCYTTDATVRWELCDVPACPDAELEAAMCRNTAAGHEFLGNLVVTKSGYPCQAWNLQSPRKHTYTDDLLYPDGSMAAAGNKCRNPDPGYRGGPWCYTTNPDVEWELCDVPFCTDIASFCKSSDAGWEFTGHLTQTITGRTCQSWNLQAPQAHAYTSDDMFPDGSVAIASNRCRNPDKGFTGGPWCFTTDPLVRWQLCDVPKCAGA